MALLGAPETVQAGTEISVDDGMTAARVGAQILELVTLDQLWTVLSARGRAGDLDTLGPVVDRMGSLLEQLADDAQLVLARVRALDDAQAEAAIANAAGPTRQSLERIESRASREGGLKQMIEKELANVGSTFSSEASELRGEYSRMREGGRSDGDMSHLTHCGVGMIEAGLGLGYGGFGVGLFVDGVERIVEHCAQPG